MNRSTAALIIAILLHLLIIALFVILGMLTPQPPEKPKEPEEQRIKVSLKEMPKAVKDALVKNKIPQKSPVAPPMPKGKQLEDLPSREFTRVPPAPYKVPQPVIKPRPPAEPMKKSEPLPEPAKHIEVPEEPVKRAPVVKTPKKPEPAHEPEKTPEVPAESSKLYSKLLTPTFSTSKQEQEIPKERESQINKNIKEAYGDTFGELSAGEQKFILDNQEIMRRITQQVLNRVARTNIPDNLRVNRYNLIEFYLYPNGDISDIKFVQRSGFYMLDDTTVETIQYAYGRYPHPTEKTLIRYKVGYYLQGY